MQKCKKLPYNVSFAIRSKRQGRGTRIENERKKRHMD
jgi:hypothetical protein